MNMQHHKLPLLLIVNLALIFLMPPGVTAQFNYDNYGPYDYPLDSPEWEQYMWDVDAYNFLHGDECNYAPYGDYYVPFGAHGCNMPTNNAAAAYNTPAPNTSAYNTPNYRPNTVGKNATNWLNEANVCYLTESYQQAADSYARAVNFDPSLSAGWLNLGNSLYALGKYQASLNAYNTLLNLEPQNADALAGKSQALLALNKIGGSNISA